jgi:hypothetical protein
MKPSQETGAFRLNEEHELFVRLEELLYEGVDEMKDDAYVPMSQQAISVIYQVLIILFCVALQMYLLLYYEMQSNPSIPTTIGS